MPAGYSGTPLAKKLGYQSGMTAYVTGAPEEYFELLAPLPAGVVFRKSTGKGVNLVHGFFVSRAKLAAALPKLMEAVRPNGMVWASWPKKASGVTTDITEDAIREIALPLGLVDVKVCAVDQTWSGLKLVVRKELR